MNGKTRNYKPSVLSSMIDLTPGKFPLRIQVEDAEIAILYSDAEGRCLYVNKKWSRVAGISREAALGDGWALALHPDDREATVADWRKAVKAGKWFERDYRFLHANGEIINGLGMSIPETGQDGKVVAYFTILADVTGHSRIERELIESEEKYRSLVEASLVGVYLIQDEKYVYVNPRFAEMFGYTVDEIINDLTVIDLVAPESIALVSEYIRQRYAGEISNAHYTPKGLRKDGRIIDLESYGGRIIYRGKPAIIGAVLDVTERKRTTDEIAALKQQMETVLAATKTGLDIIDADLNIRFVDTERRKLYGDFNGRKCHEYFEGRKTPCPECGVRRALASKRITVTEDVVIQEGKRSVQVTSIPYRDENGEWLVAEVNVDISERKLAEEALRESEIRYRSVFNSTSDGILILDMNGIVLDANDAICAILDLSREDVVEKPLKESVPPMYAGYIEEYLRQIKSEGYLHRELQTVDDSPIYAVEIVGKLFTYNNQQTVLVVVRDITERRLAEDEVRKRTKRLEAQHTKLQAATEQKASFFASMSHELRTPMTSIIGFTELLLEDLEDPVSPAQRELLLKVCQNSRRLLGMINDLLDLSRLESKRVTPVISEVDLQLLTEQVMADIEPLARDKSLKLTITNRGPQTKVYTDEHKFSQILVNMVSNAIKFTPTGRITVVTSANDKEIVLEVSDTGIGIPKSERKKIFDEFHTSFDRTKHKTTGTGLGLAITKKLCELLGGKIKLISEVDKGSTFTVTLPNRRPDA